MHITLKYILYYPAPQRKVLTMCLCSIFIGHEAGQHETVAINPAMPSSVSFLYLGGTRTKRVASGLKSGVSANRRKRFRMRWRRGCRLASPRPRLSRSASLSTSSAMSRVRRQSNSLTVHLRCSKTSSRSSTLRRGASRASYNSCTARYQSDRSPICAERDKLSYVGVGIVVTEAVVVVL